MRNLYDQRSLRATLFLSTNMALRKLKLNNLLLFESLLLYRVKQTGSQGFSSSLPFQGKG